MRAVLSFHQQMRAAQCVGHILLCQIARAKHKDKTWQHSHKLDMIAQACKTWTIAGVNGRHCTFVQAPVLVLKDARRERGWTKGCICRGAIIDIYSTQYWISETKGVQYLGRIVIQNPSSILWSETVYLDTKRSTLHWDQSWLWECILAWSGCVKEFCNLLSL